MPLQFTLSAFGRAFATRSRGAELRTELLERARGETVVVVDFDGVTNLSYSFADEFLGRLIAESSLRVETANMLPVVERSIGRAVERRRAPSALR